MHVSIKKMVVSEVERLECISNRLARGRSRGKQNFHIFFSCTFFYFFSFFFCYFIEVTLFFSFVNFSNASRCSKE